MVREGMTKKVGEVSSATSSGSSLKTTSPGFQDPHYLDPPAQLSLVPIMFPALPTALTSTQLQFDGQEYPPVL